MKFIKTAVLALITAAAMCSPAFAAGTAQVVVDRKARNGAEDGYMLLKLDPDGVDSLFGELNDNLIPGDTATGTLSFVLKPGITPVKIQLKAENKGANEMYDGMDLQIIGDEGQLYTGFLKNASEVNLGSYMNNTGADITESITLKLTFNKERSNEAQQGKTLAFSMTLIADMNDYVVIKPANYTSGRVEIYQSLYNDMYYFPANGTPVLEGQHNPKGTKVNYYPDYQVDPGKDGIIGTADDYYKDYEDSHDVYPGPDNEFGTADDRKDLNNHSTIERGMHTDPADDFGGGKKENYQNDKRYTIKSDNENFPVPSDNELIYKGRDGIYGTKDDYVDERNKTNNRPDVNGIWGTEDNETWHNGNDGLPGTMDDRLLGYPNQPKSSGGSYSGGGGFASGISGETGMASSPVAFAKPVDGAWAFDGKNWTFTTAKGEMAKNKWVYIYSKTIDQSDWYYFDANGNMQSGWQKTGSSNWYRLHSVNDARFGAMEKGLFYEADDGKYYYLDPLTGVMRTGWIKIDDKYHYFAEASSGSSSWFWNTALGRWAYNALNGRPIGSMYVNEVTPDGYRVDKNGARIEK